ncbi:hypothetical protein DSM106972_013780 [Dulcicalothrix desertica PCC 7102]|uniref:KAP NTPase domain-containing protein n=1 Tax=Dulcicalothrix desertica PCC 7102 TaxID=232991 RepID=A0A3S1APU9_9CYAN|nr:P-loop NTPase fold protein [Dulcicalothrix desertica]RUT08210.1 hypothetical protein DSM106972_013780 [Dulcicalothrix desertica PCC 7102]TWH40081.1 hypothetical protein CAL7102_09373 [Dulcicalothrix desertica PCC 7102]
MSNTKFWKPAYQLFKPEEPLNKPEDLRDFYVQRANSPVDSLITSLEMEDDPAKFLLAGHRGGGKTTELRWLQQQLNQDYTVIWVDTETALDRYNIGYAEVVVLIGVKIFETVLQSNWGLNDELLQNLGDSLKTVVLQDEEATDAGLKLPEFIEKLGFILKQGLNQKLTKTVNIRPVLSEIIERVNAIVEVAEKKSEQKLVVIVDGLDRHDFVTALQMFSSPLLTELSCHIIYSIPISLRYSPNFRQPMESFQKCLDLTNPPVFECGANSQPTLNNHSDGRDVLISIINKRLARLGNSYKGLFNPDALELICEKSGGVIRDLIRLARASCEVSLRKKLLLVDLDTAIEAVQQVRKDYTLSDYHYPAMEEIHRTGKLNTKTYNLPGKGDFVICDELLQNKFVLGYYDERRNHWFDVNPILIEDLERWKPVG